MGVGLAVSFGFGLSDLLSGVVARRIGTVVTATGSVAVGVVLLGAFVYLTGRRLPADPVWVFEVMVLGSVRSLGYIALVQAFNTGPVAVVGPIMGTTGASSVIFAVLLVHDRLDALQWFAVPVSTAGAVLAAVTVELKSKKVSLVGNGPLFAALSVVCLSAITVWQQVPIRHGGWAQTVLVRRVVELVFTAVILLILTRWRQRRADRPMTMEVDANPLPLKTGDLGELRSKASPRTLGLLFVVGAIETAAIGGLAFGLEIGPAWFMGLVTSVGGAVVAVAVGYWAFGERLRRNQWLGVGLVCVGVVLAAVG
jgi:drug/metabolite transporter (DMT)-like permease